jgi:hypothetical protein
MSIQATRIGDGPIIRPHMDGRMGSNINGATVMRVPDWVSGALARYYLYFADHRGTYIRLALADRIEGPWRMHEPGAMELTASDFPIGPLDANTIDHPSDDLYCHIASPDIHVLEDRREIRMYYHGRLEDGGQASRVASSVDGLRFSAGAEILGAPYFRAFQHDRWTYALAMPGILYRSLDGLTGFERGPQCFDPDTRHVATTTRDDQLHVFWTRAGDCPERILHSTIDMSADWKHWRPIGKAEILRPELKWEGADEPLVASVRGAIDVAVNQLRDPCIFEEDGRTYLLYCGAGEACIGLAELTGF